MEDQPIYSGSGPSATRYVSFYMSNIVLVTAEFIATDPALTYASLSYASRLDWRQNSPSASYVSYSSQPANYSLAYGYQRLHSSYPLLSYGSSYCSDITGIIDATAQMFVYWYMPEYAYTDSTTNFVGVVRLFSPVKRGSSRKYMQMNPYSSTYNNLANIMEHDFTLPYNAVLLKNGYQTGLSPTAGAAAATTALCSKLKSDYSGNIRIYVIKYRAQSNYKPVPTYNNSSPSAISHDYTAVNGCASGTSTPYLYNISTESDLKNALDTIADNIKSWAGYTEAKNVE